MAAASIAKPVSAPDSGRILAFDGLRGFAAMVVVAFHYLAMLHPEWVADYATAPGLLVDTPLAVFWNGPFAVAVFFVLSGFVMASAAERRAPYLVGNLLIRYLRLALPVLASVLLAWLWLSLMPTAARDLAATLDAPSPWLGFTEQAPLPGIGAAVHDGLAGNFIAGMSGFNNVLWAMQIELVGSAFLFLVYWLGSVARWLRFVALTVFVALGLLVLRDAYLGFVTGALIYEGHKAGIWRRLPPFAGLAALLLGMVLGAPGAGFAERWGLDVLPWRLQPGNPWGLVPVAGATLILLGVHLLNPLQRWFESALMQWLGRVSFALYLVHVPLLYTFIAWERVHIGLFEPLVVALYLLAALALAHLFTVSVDEPALRLLGRLRAVGDGLRARTRIAFASPNTAPVWPWVLLATAALMAMTLINGGVSVYYDSVVYLHRPEGVLRLLSALPFINLATTGADGMAGAAADTMAGSAAALPDEAPRIVFGGRSMFYQIFAWAGFEGGRLWPLAAAHAVMVAYPAALILARVLGVAPRWSFVLGVGALGLLTPLGLSVGTAMPDILVGVLVLAVVALMAGWDALRWWERALLFAIAAFAMVSHTSHLLLGLLLPVVLLLMPLRNKAMWRGAMMVGLACLSAVGLERVQQVLQTRHSDTVLLTRPHLVAHLVDHGPGVSYLQEACPEAGFAMCDHVDDLPIEWRAFLFGGTEPGTRFFADAGLERQKAISTEQFALTRAVVTNDPLAVMDFAAAAWLRQLVRFDPTGMLVRPEVLQRADSHAAPWFVPYPDWMQAQTRNLAVVNESSLLRALHVSTWVWTLVALGALGWALRRRVDLSDHAAPVLVCAALLLGVVLNAAICGILASPYDRFQARIIWLIPLAGLALTVALAPLHTRAHRHDAAEASPEPERVPQ